MPQTLCHSDSVSGLTILDDGHVVLWSEGRSSSMDVIVPQDGQMTVRLIDMPVCSDHPIRHEVSAIWDHDQRAMTPTEERLYDTLRGIAWTHGRRSDG